MRTRNLSLVLTMFAFGTLCACGGGGSSGAPTADEVLEAALLGIAERDGDAYDSGSVLLADGLWVGDVDGHVSRSFLGLDIASIPAGARIVSALLMVHQEGVRGEPYVRLGGALVVDHVTLGSRLDATDFDAPPLTGNVGVLSTDATPGLRTLDVTAQVQQDVDAGRTTSDFRLRFRDTLGGTERNVAMFNDADGVYGAQVPLLAVRYVLPR